jgi:hypothetical protein
VVGHLRGTLVRKFIKTPGPRWTVVVLPPGIKIAVNMRLRRHQRSQHYSAPIFLMMLATALFIEALSYYGG